MTHDTRSLGDDATEPVSATTSLGRPVFAVVLLGALAVAFAIGMSGLPGNALVAAIDLMIEHDLVQLRGPVGYAVGIVLG